MSHSSSIASSKKIGAQTGAQVTIHNADATETPLTGIKWIDSLLENYEFNRYGISAIVLLFIGIMAGVAVYMGAMTSAFEIALLIVPTMAVLVMVLAVQPMRLLLYTFFVTMIIDIAVIAYHLAIM